MDMLPSARATQQIKSLFFLYLFVARTLGDCPKPESKDNIVLTDESLLMNEYPDNTEITLKCFNGYVQESGSATMKCIDGAWGDPDLTCKKKDCGVPPPQPHMTFDISQGTLFGDVAAVICEKGYSVRGVAYKQCYNAGWTGKSTKCEIVTCGIPNAIINGKSSWNSDKRPEYGENITYVCDEGYTITGKDTIMCTEDGEYDSEPPQCLGVTKADAFTTKSVTTPTSATTSPTQETSTASTASTANTSSASSGTTSSGLRDNTYTSSSSSTVSLSARGGGILRDANNTATTITSTKSYFSQEDDDIVDTKKDIGYTPVIVSVVCVTLVACIAVFFINKLLNKRKGSYDTREDLKPELLQFQNL